MNESYRHKDKRCIFRETFNNAESVAKNGGNFTNTTFEEGYANMKNNSITTPKIISYPKKSLGTIHTLRCIVKFNSFTNVQPGLFSFFGYTTNNYAGFSYLSGAGNRFYYVTSYGTQQYKDSGLPTLQIDVWYDLICIRNGLSLLFYVNSNVIGASASLPSNTLSFFNQMGKINYATNTYYFDGLCKLAEIYNYAMSTYEIKNLYNQTSYKKIYYPSEVLHITGEKGYVEDITGKNNMIVNNVENIKYGKTNVMNFNGVNSYIDIPNSLFPSLGGVWTMTYWVRLKETQYVTDKNMPILLSYNGTSYEGVYFRRQYGHYNGNGSGTLSLGGWAQFPYAKIRSKFMFYATLHNNRTHTLYANNYAALNGAAFTNDWVAGDQNMYIGKFSTSYAEFQIVNIRLFNKNLSQDEVIQIYDYEKTKFGL
jgi:hypothetical protein